MRRRVISAGALWLTALAAILVSSAVAQQPTTISIPTRTAEVADLLRHGQQLEVERRWGDALAHYEDAMRVFPGEAALQRRFQFSRLHYDLGRRYADRSYLDELSKLTPEAALDLYEQVLLKIQAHHVEVPHWKEFVERGTSNFEVALNEPAFVQRNLPERVRTAAGEFCRQLRRELDGRVIATRSDARSAVAAAADLARQRLQIRPAVVVMEFICGATNSLDPYCTYLTPHQLTEVYSQIEGNFVGLGIELKAKDGELLIVRVIPGSPAEQSGILSGDRILSVDGRSTKDLSTDAAANLLEGKSGSLVELSVVTSDRQPRRLSVRRRRVDVPSIDRVKILDSDLGIAYLQLVCFQKTTCRDLDAALWKLHRQGMKTLIVDLRGNPGGLLVTAVEVVDKFVGRGIIVSTRGRSVQEDFTYSAHAPGTWRVPLVVLIDRDSASAAEIFAGAVRDHRRGTIVGQRSYGKGSVQGIFPLTFSSAGVRLTTARFYSPTGRPYSRIGVEPEVVVQVVAKPVDGQLTIRGNDSDDLTLAAALGAARRLGQPRKLTTAGRPALLPRSPARPLTSWEKN